MNGNIISREAFFGMAGLSENTVNTEVQAYTPISLGKGNKIRDGNSSWIANLLDIDFHNFEELRQLSPETVTATDVFVNDQNQTKFKAIVGDNTHKVYSIKTNKYKPVQNSMLVETLAQVSENTGIQVFGKMNDEGGRMSMNAFFADPDCNVDFGGHGLGGERASDPYMLGVRAYNSHTGQTGFGAEIIGVRWLCSNMCAFGDILGKCSWKHFVSEDDVVSVVGGMIESYMDKVPTLQDKIDAMRNEIIGIDDAEDLLWGAKLSPFRIEGIMAHLPELNPEIKAMAEISVYDIFNATTAYNTYSNTGGSEFGRTDMSHKAQEFITNIGNIGRFIDDGMVARQEYEEAQAKSKAVA